MAKDFQQDVTFHVYQELLGYGVDIWDGNILGEVGTSPTSRFDSKGGSKKDATRGLKEKDVQGKGFEEGTTLDLNKKAKQKITLRYSAMHNRLEAITKVISTKSMDATIRKENNEWVCLFTLTKGGPTLDTKEAHKQPSEVQAILDRYPDFLGEIPKGLLPSQGFEHIVELEEGAKSIIVMPYKHPSI